MPSIGTISVANLCSVTDLYEEGTLKAGDEVAVQASVNRDYNDRIFLVEENITNLEADAIVNAANESLLGGGGVDGAIHHAAGPGLKQACRELDGCATGRAKITPGFDLPADWVIHAVGPVFLAKDLAACERELASCYKASLELAIQNGCISIAFSCLSTGVYGYPKVEAAKIACKTIRQFMDSHPQAGQLTNIVFCCYMDNSFNIYRNILPLYFPAPDRPRHPTTPPTQLPDEGSEKQPVEANGKSSPISIMFKRFTSTTRARYIKVQIDIKTMSDKARKTSFIKKMIRRRRSQSDHLAKQAKADKQKLQLSKKLGEKSPVLHHNRKFSKSMPVLPTREWH